VSPSATHHLTTTEFFVHHDLRGYLARLDTTRHRAVRLRSATIVGNDAAPLRRFEQLVEQRNEYYARATAAHNGSTRYNFADLPDSFITMYSRFIHRFGREWSNRYIGGRHWLTFNPSLGFNYVMTPIAEEGLIAKMRYSPWPEVKQRKLQIGPRVPAEHIRRGLGDYHNTTSDQLEAWRDASRSGHLLTLNSVFARCGSDVTDAVHREWYYTFAGPVALRGDCGMGEAAVKRYFPFARGRPGNAAPKKR
jgi:hypothetical protein